ncbi:CLIP-associating protein [Eumeta japonica]|uniref:CLIP-associating protein n=1 Tax=Eumeta variegata TaxID=151549 RepID=A0A4C1SFC3_EUMVA|nr:CLIP-associating protein [Eumeta japonica]
MAYRKPNDLDSFIQLMPKADMRVKAQLAEDLVTFLSDDTNSIVCMDMGMLVDGLMPWLTGSHYKIAQKSLEAFTEIIKRLGPDFNAYTATVLPHVIDRLGDSKDTLSVRNYIQSICVLLGDPTVSVRDTAIQSLVEIYKHVGDRLRPDLRRMDDLPASKLAILEQKFDQIKSEGLLLKSAMLLPQSQINNNNGHDEGIIRELAIGLQNN